MAKLILVAVDDNDEADKLMADLGSKVVAWYQKPTTFCECPESYGTNAKSRTGAKYGWQVCPNCHRAKFTAQYLRNMMHPERYNPYTLMVLPSAWVKIIKEVWKRPWWIK